MNLCIYLEEIKNLFLHLIKEKWYSKCNVFMIGIHSMQGWTATIKHGDTRKRSTRRLKHQGNLFRKSLQLKDVC